MIKEKVCHYLSGNIGGGSILKNVTNGATGERGSKIWCFCGDAIFEWALAFFQQPCVPKPFAKGLTLSLLGAKLTLRTKKAMIKATEERRTTDDTNTVRPANFLKEMVRLTPIKKVLTITSSNKSFSKS